MRFLGLTWQGDFHLTSRTAVKARRGRAAAVAAGVLGGAILALWAATGTGVAAPLIGGGCVLGAVALLRSGIDVSLEKDGVVRVRRRGLSGARTYEDSAAAYLGLRHRTILYKKPRLIWMDDGYIPSFEDVHVQRVELVHPERDWAVPVLQKVSDEIPRREWEGYARRFHLPLLVEDGGRLVERAPEDLDKTLKELAAEGRLAGPTTAGRPPWSFAIRSSPDLIEITVRRPAVGWWPLWLGTVLPALLLVAGVERNGLADLPRLLAWVAALMAPVAYMAFIRQKIIITRARIELFRRYPFFKPRLRDMIDLKDVEQVSLRKISGDRKWSVLLTGDRGSLTLARGVNRGHLEWLRDYVTSAIVTS